MTKPVAFGPQTARRLLGLLDNPGKTTSQGEGRAARWNPLDEYFVKCTSLTPTSGRYPGTRYRYDAAANTFTAQDDVWLIEPNGNTPALDTYYLAIRAGLWTGKVVWLIDIQSAECDCCPAPLEFAGFKLWTDLADDGTLSFNFPSQTWTGTGKKVRVEIYAPGGTSGVVDDVVFPGAGIATGGGGGGAYAASDVNSAGGEVYTMVVQSGCLVFKDHLGTVILKAECGKDTVGVNIYSAPGAGGLRSNSVGQLLFGGGTGGNQWNQSLGGGGGAGGGPERGNGAHGADGAWPGYPFGSGIPGAGGVGDVNGGDGAITGNPTTNAGGTVGFDPSGGGGGAANGLTPSPGTYKNVLTGGVGLVRLTELCDTQTSKINGQSGFVEFEDADGNPLSSPSPGIFRLPTPSNGDEANVNAAFGGFW